MNLADDYFYTPLLASPTTISFWVSASSATASNTTKVQYSSDGNTWMDLASYASNGSDTGDVTLSWSLKTINANLTGDYYIRWFMSARSGGSAYFDDVLITSGSQTYVFNNHNVNNVTSYGVTGLSQATTYYYVVRAYNAYGTSDNSNEITVTTTSSSPVITVTGTLNAFSTVSGTASAAQSYSVAGVNLTADITVTAPSGFELSKTEAGTYSASLTYAPTGGTVATQNVFVRIAASAAAGSVSGDITHTSTGATQVDKAVSGTVYKGEPSNHPTDFTAADGTNPETDILVSWTDATGTVIPDGYLIKASTGGFGSITDPVDGTPENNGTFVRNVATGIESYNFTNFASNTTHYFKIFSYTNSGSSINYKLDGTIQTASHTTAVGPAISEIIVPQFMQGLNGTNEQRIPWACRLTLENLSPSSTYRYYGMFVEAADGPTTNGAGICWFPNLTGNFTRSTSLNLSTAGQYAECTTDASGSYTGWFIGEPSGNARFTPGNTLWYRIMLNDGNNGTAVATRLTTASSIKVINFGTQENVNQGTFLYGVSMSPAKNFVFVYDNEAGTGRPIAGTVVESDGLDLSDVTQILPAYKNNVDGIAGAWGVIIPNSVGSKGFTGIKRVEARVLETGIIYAANTDADGNWNGNNTVNPTGGDTTLIELTGEATLPVVLSSFTATFNAHNYVQLIWVTQTETGVQGYYIFRGRENDLGTAILVSNMIPATNTSQQQSYVFVDSEIYEDGMYYYWLQNADFDGSSAFHGPVAVQYSSGGGNNGSPNIPLSTQLKAAYPNPFNPSTRIPYDLAKNAEVKISIYNSRGQIVRVFPLGSKDAGSYYIEWNGKSDRNEDCATGVYYIRMQAGDKQYNSKAVLIK